MVTLPYLICAGFIDKEEKRTVEYLETKTADCKLPVHKNRTEFAAADMLVPWNLKSGSGCQQENQRSSRRSLSSQNDSMEKIGSQKGSGNKPKQPASSATSSINKLDKLAHDMNTTTDRPRNSTGSQGKNPTTNTSTDLLSNLEDIHVVEEKISNDAESSAANISGAATSDLMSAEAEKCDDSNLCVMPHVSRNISRNISRNAEETELIPRNWPNDAAESTVESAGITETRNANLNPVSAETEKSKLYHRYYHIFREGELEGLCGRVEDCNIINSYYDEGNWCVELKKK